MPEQLGPDFTVQANLRRRYRVTVPKRRFRGASLHEARVWQRSARRTFARLLGIPAMTRCAPAPRTTERIDAGDHWRERTEIAVEPGLTMPMFVLLPKQSPPPWPVVIAAHGHGAGGKAAVAGVADTPAMEAAIARYNAAYGPEFCRAGFITFCPEARGFGERRELLSRHDPLAPSCQWLNHMGLPLGQTATGMWVWDLMRLLDYIRTRPDCDSRRIGIAGLSGGGLQAMWTAALDRRIKAVINSGYFYGFQEALFEKHHNCSCNYVPHLCEQLDMGDIGGLIAPRPFLIQSGTQDSHNGASGMKNVRAQVRLARNVYRAFGAPDRLVHDVFEGPHRWDHAHTIPFMQAALVSSR
jgi:dienelactone hydrolase